MGKAQEQGERGSEDAQAMTIRLPRDEYEAVRTYAFVTKKTINEVVRMAVLDYLAGSGRQKQMDAIIARIQKSRRVALDKLAEM